MVTGFPSWLGNADPQGAFANELGNRLTFGLYADGNGTQFSASDITFTMTSSDPGNLFGYTKNVGDFVGGSGSANTPVLYGEIGGVWVQITDASAKYDKLVFVGMGNAPDAYVTSGLTNQQSIDAAVASLPSSYVITGTYTLDGSTGSASVGVPEPISLLLLGTMIAAIWAGRRMRLV